MPLRSDADVTFARQAAAKAMTAIGASTIKKTKFVTAVSEIARNAVIYGRGGVITFETAGAPENRFVVAECRDRGSGIVDVAMALTEGYSTGRGLGLGMSGAKRLVDRFEVVTAEGKGTTVIMECRAR